MNSGKKKSSMDPGDINFWKKRNEELEREIAQKTTDLEQKNKELLIEASLDRVLAVALSIRKPGELLKVCEVVFNELSSLGFIEMRNVLINIFDDDNEWMTDHDFSAEFGSSSARIPYKSHPIVEWSVKKMRGTDDAFTEFQFDKEELAGWKEFRRKNNEYDDPRIENISALYYYFYSIGNGAIGISTFSSIDREKLKLLKRFRNVFNLSYQRYTDIALAELQAREAQIEVALERVRARSLEMHSSDELVEASDVLFEQLNNLGIESIRTGVATFDEVNEAVEVWSRSHAGKKPENKILGVVPKNSHPFFKNCFDAWKGKKEKYFCYEIKGEEVKQYYKLMSSILSYPETNKFNPREFFYIFFFPEGSLNVVRKDPLSEEEINLMQRFAKVFGLMYRRFLDLQNAESQAREALIEAALERVRSRAMAMHKTDELLDAAELLYKELTSLEITSMAVSYAFVNEQEKNALYCGINPVDGKIPPIPFVFPHTETHVMRSILSSWKKQEAFYVIELDEKATLTHQTWVGEHIQTTFAKNNIPFSVEEFLAISPQTAVIYSFHFTQGYLF
ncbi:MAG: hypothetical protein SGI89_03675, partial [bacterium]|nr:hypothetical protein [bacterium]